MKHLGQITKPNLANMCDNSKVDWWCWGIGCLFMPQWWANKGKGN